jgi:ATP-dependent RNA helicase DeaD
VLEYEDPTSAIVFCRTRVEVDELTDTLNSHGYGAQALHGGMEQRARDRVMQAFRGGKADVLVATDVAARGLDIDHVSHVINYDIPTAAEVYVHRIGRTGRVGREGVAITLIDPREQRMLRQIESLTKQKVDVVPLPSPAALQAKRLEGTRAAILKRVTAGGLDDMRALVASLAHDTDVVDIAAAAIALVHEEAEAMSAPAPAVAPEPSYSGSSRYSGGSRDSRDSRPSGPSRNSGRFGPSGVRVTAGPRTPSRSNPDAGPMTSLFVGAGKAAGIRPGDLVGAITNEAHVEAREIGAIRVADRHSLVEVPEAIAEKVIKALRATKLRGQKVDVKRASQ